MREVFEYAFTKLDPVSGAHIDPPSVAIYDTLIRKGPGGTALPGLAESWTTSPDDLTWRVTLRDDAVFHSGRRCDAVAVAEALERCRFGDFGWRQVWYWDPVDVVSVLDPATIEIRLHFPYRRLPTLLWSTHTAIFNDARRRLLRDDYGVEDADGTGPFLLAGFDPARVEAAQSPSGRPGVAQRIEWVSMPDERDRAAVLEQGTADVVRAPPYDLITGLLGDPRWRVIQVPECSQFYWGLNFGCRQLDFHRLEMRAAIEAAVDRDALVQAAFSGHGDARRSPLPAADPLAASWNPGAAGRMSMEEARRSLDLMGWRLRESGVRVKHGTPLAFECVAQDSPVFRRLAAVLRDQVAQLGVRVDFVFVEPFEQFYAACDQQPASFLNKWLWQDPLEAIIGFTRSSCACEGSPNWQSARVPALDAAYDAFLGSGTDEETWNSAARVQDVFMRELPYIPLCAPVEAMVIGAHVQGFAPVAGTLYPYYDLVSLR
ncbi:MAG: ABC transporter substrate-binding protein [Streptosporangiaceae bacterium]